MVNRSQSPRSTLLEMSDAVLLRATDHAKRQSQAQSIETLDVHDFIVAGNSNQVEHVFYTFTIQHNVKQGHASSPHLHRT